MGSTIPCSYISVLSLPIIFGTMERFIPGRCMKPISGIFTAPKEHIYKSLRFVHSPMSPFIFKQVYKKFTTLVYLSSSTMNLQAKIGVYKAVNYCK